MLVGDNDSRVSLGDNAGGEPWRPALCCEEVSRRLIEERYKHDWRPGCGLRIGPHFYNTDEEVHRFMDRVVALAGRT